MNIQHEIRQYLKEKGGATVTQVVSALSSKVSAAKAMRKIRQKGQRVRASLSVDKKIEFGKQRYIYSCLKKLIHRKDVEEHPTGVCTLTEKGLRILTGVSPAPRKDAKQRVMYYCLNGEAEKVYGKKPYQLGVIRLAKALGIISEEEHTRLEEKIRKRRKLS